MNNYELNKESFESIRQGKDNVIDELHENKKRFIVSY